MKFINRVILALLKRFYFLFSDKKFLECRFFLEMGKKLDIKNPQTFNEKLQWLKLYDRKPIYTTMVDKVAVKDYVAKIIGEEYIIPTLGTWKSFDEINFEKLPNQFVLKSSNGGGNTGVIICKDKDTLDKKQAKKKLEKSLNTSIYKYYKEWPYKSVDLQILAEEIIIDESSSSLVDYKFYCFNGEPKLLFVATGRGEDVKFDYYDMNFNRLPIKKGHKDNSKYGIEKPINFDKMIDIAEKLSQGIPHVRIDLYNVKGKIYFGEITFYTGSGFSPFEPDEWDYTLGSWIKF